ncbi:MAG: hypothetical protein RJA51_159 [Actinomycetota bacterium]
MNLAARWRQSGRMVAENVGVTHSTGTPSDSFMTLSMTSAGYEVLRCEIMSFVPRAMTIAVGLRVVSIRPARVATP